jgi:hypothetical protein
VQGVIHDIMSRDQHEVEEVLGTTETMDFALPKELRIKLAGLP